MTRRIPLVLGHFGGDNAGDEAILEGTCHLLAAVDVDAIRVVARRSDYRPSPGLPVAVETIRPDPVALFRAVLGASTVVFAGGTHFDDQFGGTRRLRHYRYLARFLAVFALARVARRPVVALGQGIGPLPHRPGRLLARVLFALVPNGTVRDDASYRLARQLGAGTGWRRTFDSAAAAPGLWREGEERAAVAGIAPVFGTAPDGLWPACATALLCAYERGAIDAVHVIAFRSGDREHDLDAATELVTALAGSVTVTGTEFGGNVTEIADALGTCRVVLCGRYHSLVLALLAGAVPVVLPAHAKLVDAAALVGLPPALIVSDPSVSAIVAAIDAALDFDARKLRPVLDDLRLTLVDDVSILARAEANS
jgi:polysaccharide pyruvyl transferase WcaK-like protein